MFTSGYDCCPGIPCGVCIQDDDDSLFQGRTISYHIAVVSTRSAAPSTRGQYPSGSMQHLRAPKTLEITTLYYACKYHIILQTSPILLGNDSIYRILGFGGRQSNRDGLRYMHTSRVPAAPASVWRQTRAADANLTATLPGRCHCTAPKELMGVPRQLGRSASRVGGAC